VKRENSRLKIVNAVQLEPARADLAIEDMKNYSKKASETLRYYHPLLLCNWDQTTSDNSPITIKPALTILKDGEKLSTMTFYR